MFKKIVFIRILIIFIFPLFLILFGRCSPKKGAEPIKNEQKTDLQQPVKPASREASNENVYVLEKLGKDNGTTPPNPPVGSAQVFLKSSIESRVLPEDFKIGLLQDSYSQDIAHRNVLKTVDNFCRALEEGLVLADLVDARNQDLITQSLIYYVKSSVLPRSHRIGTIDFYDQGECMVPVRLIGGIGTAEGEFYLVKKDEVWFIQDIQINLQHLQGESKSTGEKFKPNKYSNILESF